MSKKEHLNKPEKGLRVKRNASTGRFIDIKKDSKKFKGIRKEATFI